MRLILVPDRPPETLGAKAAPIYARTAVRLVNRFPCSLQEKRRLLQTLSSDSGSESPSPDLNPSPRRPNQSSI